MTVSTFVEHAERQVAESPILPGDEQANDLLQEARAHIYYWPKDFRGFECNVTLRATEGCFQGHLRATSAKEFQFDWSDDTSEVLKKWSHSQVGEFLAHRESPKANKMTSRTGVRFGDTCPVYGPQLIFEGDKMHSYYRVRDHRITQIYRAYAGQYFIINIDDHDQLNGRFAATVYQAFYWDAQTNQLAKVETYHDSYCSHEGLLLPTARRYCEVVGPQSRLRHIFFDDHKLL